MLKKERVSHTKARPCFTLIFLFPIAGNHLCSTSIPNQNFHRSIHSHLIPLFIPLTFHPIPISPHTSLNTNKTRQYNHPNSNQTTHSPPHFYTIYTPTLHHPNQPVHSLSIVFNTLLYLSNHSNSHSILHTKTP